MVWRENEYMKFAVFIISHERADRVDTYTVLKKGGYTGKIFVVVDDVDKQLNEYKERFKKNLLIFNKMDYIDSADTVEPYKRYASAVYARNAVEDFAKEIHLDTFLMIDDDITGLRYRWVENGSVKSLVVKGGLDKVFEYYSQYMLDTEIACTSFPFTMFYIAGTHDLERRISEYRHTYQIHIRNAHKEVEWTGTINHDTITQLLTMKKGYIWWSIPHLVFDAKPMNSEKGGLKEVYDTIGDFNMAFLAMITSPDCCSIVPSKGKRSSLQIKENKLTSYPMIVSQEYKK